MSTNELPRLRWPAVKDSGEILDRKQTLFKIGVSHGAYPFAVAVVSVERHRHEDKLRAPRSLTTFYGGKKVLSKSMSNAVEPSAAREQKRLLVGPAQNVSRG